MSVLQWCLALALAGRGTASEKNQLIITSNVSMSMDFEKMEMRCEFRCSGSDSQQMYLNFNFPNNENDDPDFSSMPLSSVNCSPHILHAYSYELTRKKLAGGSYNCDLKDDGTDLDVASKSLEVPFQLNVTTSASEQSGFTKKELARGVAVTCAELPNVARKPTITATYKRGEITLAEDFSTSNASSADGNAALSLRLVKRCLTIEVVCSHEFLQNTQYFNYLVHEELQPSSYDFAVLSSDRNVSVLRRFEENVEVVHLVSLENVPILIAQVRLNCSFNLADILQDDADADAERPIKIEDVYIDVLRNAGHTRGNSLVWSNDSYYHISLDWLLFYADTPIVVQCGVMPYAPKRFRVVLKHSLILHNCGNLQPSHRTNCSVDCYVDEQEFTIILNPQLKGLTKTTGSGSPAKSYVQMPHPAATEAACSVAKLKREIDPLGISDGGPKILALEVALDEYNNLLFDCVVFRGLPPLTGSGTGIGANVSTNGVCLKGDNCVLYREASFEAFSGSKRGHDHAAEIAAAAEDKHLVHHIWGVHKLDNFVTVQFNITCAIQQETSTKSVKLNYTFTSSLLSTWKLFASSIVLLLVAAYTHVLPIWDYTKKLTTPGAVHCIVLDKREGKMSKMSLKRFRKSEDKGKTGAGTGKDASKQAKGKTSKKEQVKKTWRTRIEDAGNLLCPPLPHISLSFVLAALTMTHFVLWCVAHSGRKTDSIFLSVCSLVTDVVTLGVLLRCSCMTFLALETRSMHEATIENLKNCKFQ